MSNDFNVARDRVLRAMLEALGPSAPERGTPRYTHLQTKIVVLLKDGKADSPRLLSRRVREALLDAIAMDRKRVDDWTDIIRDGFDGYRYSSDLDVIALASDLSFQEIAAVGRDARSRLMEQAVLEDFSRPRVADVALRGTFDPQSPEHGLLGSLSAELSRRGMPNPFHAAIAEMFAEEPGAMESERG